MKTTMITRNIANPRRTTLADVQDAAEAPALATRSGEHPAGSADLPARTANPRRTVLVEPR